MSGCYLVPIVVESTAQKGQGDRGKRIIRNLESIGDEGSRVGPTARVADTP